MNNIILIIFALVGYILFFMFPLNKGAPFIPNNPKKLISLLNFLKQKYGLEHFKNAIDLGSGDGRIVVFMTKNGVNCNGVELNKVLFNISKRKLKREKIENKCEILRQDLFETDLSKYDLVLLWQSPQIMKKLGDKLKKELKPGTVICSYYFAIPGFKKVVNHYGWHIYEV